MGIESSAEVFSTNQEVRVTEQVKSRSVEDLSVPIENLSEQVSVFEEDKTIKKEETLGEIIKIEEDEELDADCEEKGHDHGIWSRLKWRIVGIGLVFVGGVLLLIPGIGGGVLIAIPAIALVVTGNVCLFKKKFGKMWSWTKRKTINLFKKNEQLQEKTA